MKIVFMHHTISLINLRGGNVEIPENHGVDEKENYIILKPLLLWQSEKQ